MVFVFGCHQEVFAGPAPFKIYLNGMYLTYIFNTLTVALCVRNHYVVSLMLEMLLLLVGLKPTRGADQDHIIKKSGIIYRYRYGRVECNEAYIGESSRTFGARFREHLKAPSPICEHFNITGHTTTLENFSKVVREDQNLMRLRKESIYIRVNSPSLNKKYRQIPSASHMT